VIIAVARVTAARTSTASVAWAARPPSRARADGVPLQPDRDPSLRRLHREVPHLRGGRSAGRFWYVLLAMIGVLNSVVSLFYYARIIKAVYLDEPVDQRPLAVPRCTPDFWLRLRFPSSYWACTGRRWSAGLMRPLAAETRLNSVGLEVLTARFH